MLGRKQKKQTNQPRNVQSSGRANAPVFSYHSSRSADTRTTGRGEYIEVKRTLPKPDFRYIPTWLSIAAIAFSALYSLTLVSDAHVAIVQPSSSLTRSTAQYQKATDDLLKSSFWNYTKLTVDTEAVANQLQTEFPEIQHIAVTIPLLGRRPAVEIQTAAPAFVLSSTRSGAFYVDNDGRVMVKVSDIAQPQAGVMIVRDDSGLPAEPNKQILPKDTVAFITTIMKQLAAQNVPVDYFELPTTPYEVQLRIKDKPYYVRFNTQADSRQQAGTYLAVKARLEGEGATPSTYIDVRVPERAYYK